MVTKKGWASRTASAIGRAVKFFQKKPPVKGDAPTRRLPAEVWRFRGSHGFEPAAEISAPPVARWAADGGDEALAAELRELADGWARPWCPAVAVGVFIRLFMEGSASARRQAVEDLLAGRATDPTNPARIWARYVSAINQNALEDLVLGEVERISRCIDEVRRDLVEDGYDDPWYSDFRDLCIDRDNLESVLVVLAAGGWGRVRDLYREIEGLDAAGEELLDWLEKWPGNIFNPPPGVPVVESERLTRVALGNPDAWWAKPAGVDFGFLPESARQSQGGD